MNYAPSNDIVSKCCGKEIEYDLGLKVCSECGEQCESISEDEYYDQIDDM